MIAIPELELPPTATMSWEGVNEMVAEVVAALTLFARVIASSIIGVGFTIAG